MKQINFLHKTKRGNSVFKILMLFSLFCFFTIQTVSAQQKITGTVTDNNGEALPGASIIEKGTANGVVSDFDGNFSIDLINSNSVIVVSFIGYATKEVSLNGKTNISITLDEDAQSLDEVLIVGYGTQSRAEVTGAIATVNSEELAAIPVANAEQALQGRASGVTVINSGSPGSSTIVRIRGLSTIGYNGPLYVVDGVIVGSLSGISTEDIESINVLKDASTTAIYGSKGSNGVVMVTTKKGKSGSAKISFSTYAGIQNMSKRYDVLNTSQYLQYASDAFGVNLASEYSNSGLNTNWQDEIFQDGLIQNYDLSISGGNENLSYRFSANVFDQEGIMIETGFKRYSFRANSEYSKGKFKFGETMSISFNDKDVERYSGGRTNLEHAIKMAPYLPVRNSDNLGGFQGPTSLDGQDAENPVRIQSLGYGVDNAIVINGSVYGEYELLDGLKFKSLVGLSYYNYDANRFSTPYSDGVHSQSDSYITKNSGINKTLTFTNSLTYKKTFADVHNLELLVLAENYDENVTIVNASSVDRVSAGAIDQLSNEGAGLSSTLYETKRISYLGRVNYNFDGKYIVAASLRRDASSRFGSSNRWANFPSLALGWNIAKESFLEDTSFSNLKLRGSWGIVGNDNISNYEYSASLTVPNYFIYSFNNAEAYGTTIDGLPNSDLRWEETTQVNVGLDFGLFNEKITGSFEYYQNKSKDFLLSVQLPTSLGFNDGTVTQNVGSLETKGFEFNLGYNYDNGEDFTFSANVNLGTSKNEMLSLGDNAQSRYTYNDFEGEQISGVSVGESIFYFYGLETDGIYDTQAEVDAVLTANPGQTIVQPGDVRFVDHNGDGDITDADKVVIGNPYPDITYGFNLNSTYKNWDLNLFISGVSGNEIYNTNKYDLEGMTRLFNAGTAVLDRWTGPGTSNSIPRAGGAPQNYAVSDRFVEDGSYTRLKNLSIGYNFPKNTLGKDLFSSFRIYASGLNLITLTNYSGLDPEVGTNAINGSQTEIGIDRGNYPQPKTFMLGLQVSF